MRFTFSLGHPIHRLLFLAPLGVFGLMHFAVPSHFDRLVPDFVPGGRFWVYFSGVALTGAALSIITRYLAKLATAALLVFVTTFILAVDLPWVFAKNEWLAEEAFISLLKDVSLFGGTLMFYSLYRKPVSEGGLQSRPAKWGM